MYAEYVMRVAAALFSLATLFILMRFCNSESKLEKNPICMGIIFMFISLMYNILFTGI